MPHAIFFMTDGHAVHGSYEVGSLGRPVSHGCVRIAPKNATTLYALVEKVGLKNAQVSLTGVTPGGEYKIAGQPKPSRATPKSASRAGVGSTYAQEDSGYLRDDQFGRGGFFRRLFGGSR
jgi:L,D-transpeptidase catalytic domain